MKKTPCKRFFSANKYSIIQWNQKCFTKKTESNLLAQINEKMQ